MVRKTTEVSVSSPTYQKSMIQLSLSFNVGLEKDLL